MLSGLGDAEVPGRDQCLMVGCPSALSRDYGRPFDVDPARLRTFNERVLAIVDRAKTAS